MDYLLGVITLLLYIFTLRRLGSNNKVVLVWKRVTYNMDYLLGVITLLLYIFTLRRLGSNNK
ncbi:hypothetical protein, partial [Photobacterium lucens]|uniref:hypothetical protein n=1 Tax=Photobacterium lucens TaxID=2562949 RepID=UPI001F178257